MKKKVIAVLLALVIAAVGFLYFPRGGVIQAVNAAVLGVLSADIDASRGGGAFEPALDGDVFATGDVVRANDNGRAVLTFFEGSTLSVDPGGHVKVLSLVKTSSGGIQLDVEQTAGRTWASVSKLTSPDSRFQIKTPSMTATVRGTTFETTVVRAADGKVTTTISTDEGEVVVQATSGGGEVRVPAGTQVDVQEDQPAPAAPQAQPPTPKLRFSGPAGVGFVVIDPRGRPCGLSGATSQRQIPRCELLGGAGQTVVIGEVVAGTYSLVLTAAQPVPDAAIVAEGLGIQATDFTSRITRSVNVGDLIRTTLVVAVAADGKLSSPGFTPPDLVTSVCGAEAAGRVFSSGKLTERADALVAFAQSSKGQPAAIVYTQAELAQAAIDGVKDAQASLPVTVSNVTVVVDNGGAHISAQVSAGPLNVTAKGDVIAGVQERRLVLRTRNLDAAPLPQSITDQLAGALDRSLSQFATAIPLDVSRVAFRSGCFALIGKTPS